MKYLAALLIFAATGALGARTRPDFYNPNNQHNVQGLTENSGISRSRIRRPIQNHLGRINEETTTEAFLHNNIGQQSQFVNPAVRSPEPGNFGQPISVFNRAQTDSFPAQNVAPPQAEFVSAPTQLPARNLAPQAEFVNTPAKFPARNIAPQAQFASRPAKTSLSNLGKPSGEYERQQAESARYSFSTDIDDKISDLTHSRKETREGLKVMGSYSYSDGYLKRTVHYVADENGYRVTGEEAAPLDGPNIDLEGTASVDTAAHGRHIAYRVQSVPVPGPVPKILNELSDITETH